MGFDRVAFVWTSGKVKPPAPGNIPVDVVSSLNLPALLGCDAYAGKLPPDLSQYDLYIIMEFGVGTRFVQDIKRQRPDAVVIVSVDPPPEHVFQPAHWHNRYETLIDELSAADYIGSRMYSQQDVQVYANLVGFPPDRIVTIPIPIGPDDFFAALRQDTIKEGFILTLDHNWEPTISAPNIAALKTIQDATALPIKYVQAAPHSQALATHIGLDVEFLPRQTAGAFVRLAARATLAVDMYAMHSVGRFGMLCAYAGTPCVSSNTTDHHDIRAAFAPYDGAYWNPRAAKTIATSQLTVVQWRNSYDAVRQHFTDYILPLPVRAFQHWQSVHDIAALNTAPALDWFWANDWVSGQYYKQPGRLQLFDRVIEQYREHYSIDLSRTDQPISVLDVGCGPGMFLSFLQSEYPHVRLTGIDYAQSAITQAAQRLSPGTMLITGDVMTVSRFNGVQFDVVFAFEVLEHQDDPQAFIERLCTFVKPGGHVVLTIPDGAHDTWHGHKQRWTLDAFDTFLAQWDGRARALPGLPNLMGVLPI